MSTKDMACIAASLMSTLRTRAPRVQCLTNTVAQAITANVLHAVGVRASMATHLAEVEAMSSSADALLINLGTPDEAREAAIPLALAAAGAAGRPIVLDPVFVDASALRMGLVQLVLARPGVTVKANAREWAALDRAGLSGAVNVKTGAVDEVVSAHRRCAIANGHPHMAAVTGLGCAAGALVAAFQAIGNDAFLAAVAAMLVLGIAGELAGARAAGPGSFAVALLDELYRLDETTLVERARIS